MTAAMPLERVRPEPARRQRLLHQRPPLGDQITAPDATVLVAQQDESPARVRAAAVIVQQHQRQQTHHLGLGQQLAQTAVPADRLAGQVVPRQDAPDDASIPR